MAAARVHSYQAQKYYTCLVVLVVWYFGCCCSPMHICPPGGTFPCGPFWHSLWLQREWQCQRRGVGYMLLRDCERAYPIWETWLCLPFYRLPCTWNHFHWKREYINGGTCYFDQAMIDGKYQILCNRSERTSIR